MRIFIRNVMIVAVFAVALELLYFNFPMLSARLDTELSTDVSYMLKDLVLVNMDENSHGYVSKEDPQLFAETDSMKIQQVEVNCQTEPMITSLLFYYTDAENVVQVISAPVASDGSASIRLNQNVGPILRIDPGEAAGVRLLDCSITINSTHLRISPARIVAVVLIYVCGFLLFRIQRMPDYHLDQKIKNSSIPREDKLL